MNPRNSIIASAEVEGKSVVLSIETAYSMVLQNLRPSQALQLAADLMEAALAANERADKPEASNSGVGATIHFLRTHTR